MQKLLYFALFLGYSWLQSSSNLLFVSGQKQPEVRARQPENDGQTKTDPTEWMWSYFDEQTRGFNLKVEEDSLDERLANVNFLVSYTRGINTDSYTVNMGDEAENRELERQTAGSKVNDDLCGQQLEQMLEQIDRLELIQEERRQYHSSGLRNNNMSQFDEAHYRMARIVDSLARYEGGSLAGRHLFLGSYRQCEGSQILLDRKQVTTRYCLARLRPSLRRLHPSLKSMQRPADMASPNLIVGTCLPQSCHTKSFRSKRNKQLAKRLVDGHFRLPESLFIELNPELESVFCKPDEDSPVGRLPLGGKLLIGLLVTWISGCLIATLRPNWISNAHLRRSLNLAKSWEDFTLSSKKGMVVEAATDRHVDLDTLSAVKVIFSALATLFHAMGARVQLSSDLVRSNGVFERDPWLFVLLNTGVVIDTFFVITGMLFVYLTLCKLDKEKDKTSSIHQFFGFSLEVFARRYLRFVPLYALIFWFKKSVFNHLGSGFPLWDHALNRATFAGGCARETWLTPFTLSSPFLNMATQCEPQSWSVVSDITFMIVLAPITLLLARRPLIGLLLTVVVAFSSLFAMVAAWSAIDPGLMGQLRHVRLAAYTTLFNRYSVIYSMPQYRIFSIMVGAWAGFSLYLYRQGADWPNWFRAVATKWAVFVITAQVLSAPLVALIREAPLSGPLITDDTLIHGSTSARLFWSVANAILFLRMTTDWKDTIWMQISKGKFWKVMSLLNYSVTLVHLDVIMFDGQNSLSVIPFSRYRIISLFASTYTFSFLIGLVLYLVIENPIDKLTKSLLFSRQRECSDQKMDKKGAVIEKID